MKLTYKLQKLLLDIADGKVTPAASVGFHKLLVGPPAKYQPLEDMGLIMPRSEVGPTGVRRCTWRLTLAGGIVAELVRALTEKKGKEILDSCYDGIPTQTINRQGYIPAARLCKSCGHPQCVHRLRGRKGLICGAGFGTGGTGGECNCKGFVNHDRR